LTKLLGFVPAHHLDRETPRVEPRDLVLLLSIRAERGRVFAHDLLVLFLRHLELAHVERLADDNLVLMLLRIALQFTDLRTHQKRSRFDAHELHAMEFSITLVCTLHPPTAAA